MDNSSKIEESSVSSQHHSVGHRLVHHLKNSKKNIRINSKTAIIIGCVIVVGAILFSYKSLFIAATVNGSPISRWAVIHELENKSGKSVLDNLITEKLINDEATKKKISVTNEEIDVEIKKIEQQVIAQGGTLDKALESENMTLEALKNNITIEKKLEKLLADKIQVSDTEIQKFIKDNKVVIPKGEEATYNEQIMQQIKQQKLSTEAGAFIESLKSQAKINRFVNY